MRNLLLLLLLANVLYFMWQQFIVDNEETGIVIVSEADLGPPLQLTDGIPVETSDAGGDTVETGKSIKLPARVGRSCVSLGPFRESEEADAAQSEYESEGMDAKIRTTQGEIFVGHWVQIRDIPDRTTAEAMLKKLNDGGLAEAYMVRTDEGEIKISLGLFGDMSGAERTELQAKSMDLPADISPRMREATVFYVDIGLSPGRGAGTMIEKYGEERVLLRDAATCPRS